MLSWWTIGYGALLASVGAGVVALLLHRRALVAATCAAGALVGSASWNAVLRAAGGRGFLVDAPLTLLPASWQDVGSGVWTTALTAVALGAGPLSAGTGRRVSALSATSGLLAFVVDVYLY